jgi:hypothetical protein
LFIPSLYPQNDDSRFLHIFVPVYQMMWYHIPGDHTLHVIWLFEQSNWQFREEVDLRGLITLCYIRKFFYTFLSCMKGFIHWPYWADYEECYCQQAFVFLFAVKNICRLIYHRHKTCRSYLQGGWDGSNLFKKAWREGRLIWETYTWAG